MKLRKNVLTAENVNYALGALRTHSKIKHANRGAAAGVLDKDKLPQYVGQLVNPKKFRTKFIARLTGKQSKQTISNYSRSNIIGYFEKPDRNVGNTTPCRETAFNRDNPGLWELALPLLKEIDLQYKTLLPEYHNLQLERCQKSPNFAIGETAFSTATVNYSWRTACHKDIGDFMYGFGNLVVIEDDRNPNQYNGCYTGFPQYGVAANVRTGDFLAMDVHEWHCNTEFKQVNDKLIGLENDIINGWCYNRLSLVCYLRENMIDCK